MALRREPLQRRSAVVEHAYVQAAVPAGRLEELDLIRRGRRPGSQHGLAFDRPRGQRAEELSQGEDVERRSARSCLLYTSDAADEEDSVDLGGRRIIKKKM